MAVQAQGQVVNSAEELGIDSSKVEFTKRQLQYLRELGVDVEKARLAKAAEHLESNRVPKTEVQILKSSGNWKEPKGKPVVRLTDAEAIAVENMNVNPSDIESDYLKYSDDDLVQKFVPGGEISAQAENQKTAYDYESKKWTYPHLANRPKQKDKTEEPKEPPQRVLGDYSDEQNFIPQAERNAVSELGYHQ